MSEIESNIPHELLKAEALTLIQNFLPQLKAQHFDQIKDLQESWKGNFGEFKKSWFKVSGTLQVEENFMITNVELPFAALFI